MQLITSKVQQNAATGESIETNAVPFANVEIQPRVLLLIERPAYFHFVVSEADKRVKACGNDKQNEFNKRHWLGNAGASYCAMPPDIGLARQTGNAYYKSFEAADGRVTTTKAWTGSVAVAHDAYATIVDGATSKEAVWQAIEGKASVAAFGEAKARKTLASVVNELQIFGLIRLHTDGSFVHVSPFEVETTNDQREGKGNSTALALAHDNVIDADFTDVTEAGDKANGFIAAIAAVFEAPKPLLLAGPVVAAKAGKARGKAKAAKAQSAAA